MPAGFDAPLVALLVPLSGRQQSVGMAVRDGFIAAHLEAPASRRFNTLIIDETRVGAAQAHRQALEAGARVLVGPLLKESVQALAPFAGQLNGPMPGQLPVLALNNLADTDPGTGGLWQFGLAPEDEAREVAGRALALGQRRALVLIPASEWGQRLLAAFTSEFTLGGGEVVDTRTYLPGAADFTGPIRSLLQTTDPPPRTAVASTANGGEKPSLAPGRRQDVDLIFVGANSSNGRQLVPQLKFFGGADLPTYSTSAIWDDGAADTDDLNGVVFADTPWVIAPDDRAQMVRNSLVRHWGRATLGVSRFYALGYDAYRLLPDILRQPSPGPFGAGEIAGATGMLYADGTGRIHRRLAFAQIHVLQAEVTTDAVLLMHHRVAGFDLGQIAQHTFGGGLARLAGGAVARLSRIQLVFGDDGEVVAHRKAGVQRTHAEHEARRCRAKILKARGGRGAQVILSQKILHGLAPPRAFREQQHAAGVAFGEVAQPVQGVVGASFNAQRRECGSSEGLRCTFRV